MFATRRSFAPTAAALTVLAGALAGSGCTGHGRNTSEQMTLAQQRMAQIKSATEWEMAEQAYRVGDLDRALEKVNTSIAMNPSVAKSHVLKGRVLLEQGELERARQSLLRAEVISPNNDEAHYYLGVVNERLAKREDALARYMKSVELSPDEALYVVAAAELMIDLDRADEAQAFLDSRAAAFDHNAGVRQTLGHLAMMRSDYTRAIELFREARLLAPEAPSMLEDLVFAQFTAGEFAEAEFGIAQLIRQDENEGRRDLLRMRARCFIELDRTIEAREVLLTLTAGDEGEKDIESWLDLGSLAYRTNDMTRLRQASTKLIALVPSQPDGYVFRAIWLREHGDSAKALETLERGFQYADMPVDAVLLRGVIEQDLGMYAAAERSFRSAAESSPDDRRAAVLLELLEAPARDVATFPIDSE
ncbi:MAG: tetratricopeptide repeat protein [Planctomycetota bacterium]